MRMHQAYEEHNANCRSGILNDRPFLVADLCKPGVVTAALRHFRERIAADESSWDYHFESEWSNTDMVDLVLSTVITQIVSSILDQSDEGLNLIHSLRPNPRSCKQLLLLASLYAEADSDSLASLRKSLMPRQSWHLWATRSAATAFALSAGAFAATSSARVSNSSNVGPVTAIAGDVHAARVVDSNPRTSLVCTSSAAATGASLLYRRRRRASERRASELQRTIRVAPRRPIRHLIDRMFCLEDSADTIQANYIGNSIHSKLDFLRSLAQRIGYKDVAVFGDCFDEVAQLDPVSCPKAIKRFAREVCRNDFLNFGRMVRKVMTDNDVLLDRALIMHFCSLLRLQHFYFPDSRIALDLNTDRVMKDARFVRTSCSLRVILSPALLRECVLRNDRIVTSCET